LVGEVDIGYIGSLNGLRIASSWIGLGPVGLEGLAYRVSAVVQMTDPPEAAFICGCSPATGGVIYIDGPAGEWQARAAIFLVAG